jgi:hypothetical protein
VFWGGFRLERHSETSKIERKWLESPILGEQVWQTVAVMDKLTPEWGIGNMKVDLQELKDSVDRELVQLEKRRTELQGRKEQIEAVQRLVHEVGVPAEGSEAAASDELPEESPEPAKVGGEGRNWFNRA